MMKVFNQLLTVLIGGILCTACTEKETVVNYGYVCSDNLFKFVEINATYTTDKGEEISVDLTPEIMETFRDEVTSVETSDGTSTVSSSILEWRQSKKYDDEIKATLTITFKKNEGVDYTLYKGQVMKITNHPYLISKTNGVNYGFGINLSTSNSIELDLTTSVELYGDALEDYIDKLVANPIVK